MERIKRKIDVKNIVVNILLVLLYMILTLHRPEIERTSIANVCWYVGYVGA